jgi:hypothetical protein
MTGGFFQNFPAFFPAAGKVSPVVPLGWPPDLTILTSLITNQISMTIFASRVKRPKRPAVKFGGSV